MADIPKTEGAPAGGEEQRGPRRRRRSMADVPENAFEGGEELT